MIQQFESLREDEQEFLLNAPILVAILIAGADGKIDSSERQEAITVARSKQLRAREELVEYYQVVGERFEDKFNSFTATFSDDADERRKEITTELRKLNFILPKVDKNFSIMLHASLKDLAKKIAEASGGVLGYLSVSREESILMELKMINTPG
ncbi:MAG: thiamine kinase-like enzyme [Cyclobacteriaceae bacterium]|jgi:thiamine kinase-like enzyme